MPKVNKKKIEAAAADVVQLAEQYGVKDNFFFISTMHRYRVQMSILEELEKAISETGTLVTKEYVKGRGNVYTNPAITEYNKTATAANNSVATLINIVKTLKNDEEKEESLADMMSKLVSGDD